MVRSDTMVARVAESTPVDTVSAPRHEFPVALLRSPDAGDEGWLAGGALGAPRADRPIPLSKSVRLPPTAAGF